MSIFANYGLGRSKNEVEKENTMYSGRYRRFSIQPAVGFNFKYIEFTFGFRYTFTNFNDFRHYENSALVESKELRFNTIDPFISFGGGSEKFRVVFMSNPVFPASIFSDSNNFPAESFSKVTGNSYSTLSDILGYSFGFTLLFFPSSQ